MKVQSLIIAALAILAMASPAVSAETCRRFIPSAGVTVETPCPEATVAKQKAPVVPVVAPAPEQDAPVVAVPAVIKSVPAKPTKTAHSGRDSRLCGAILDRAVQGNLTAADRDILRNQCRS